MIDEEIEKLSDVVFRQHNARATFACSVPIRETFQGRPVWEGVVHVFDLQGHPSATRAYAWSAAIDGSDKRRVYAVLGDRGDQDAAGCGAGGNRGGTQERVIDGHHPDSTLRAAR